MVFGNMGETSRHWRCVHAQSRDRRASSSTANSCVNAQGEDVVAGIRTPQDLDEGRARAPQGPRPPSLEEAMPEAYQELGAHLRPARAPLPGHAGHRVHRRAGQAVDAADPQRASAPPRPRSRSRSIMASEGLIDAGRQRCSASIPLALDQLLHPTLDPKAHARRAGAGPAGLARRGRRARSCSTADEAEQPRADRRKRHSRARRDEPEDIHGMHAAEGHPDRARRHDLATPPWWRAAWASPASRAQGHLRSTMPTQHRAHGRARG